MKQLVKRTIQTVCATVALAAAPAMAVTISINPATQVGTVGSPLLVDILIADLGDFSSPALGNFDIFVSYDSSLLTPTDAAYGTQLNQGDSFDSFQDGLLLESGPTAECPTASCFEIAEISFLSDQDLIDGQPADFVVASITFDTLAAGTSALAFQFTEFGDEFGDEIFGVLQQNGSITVEAAIVAVPLPASLLLFSTMLFWRRRAR